MSKLGRKFEDFVALSTSKAGSKGVARDNKADFAKTEAAIVGDARLRAHFQPHLHHIMPQHIVILTTIVLVCHGDLSCLIPPSQKHQKPHHPHPESRKESNKFHIIFTLRSSSPKPPDHHNSEQTLSRVKRVGWLHVSAEMASDGVNCLAGLICLHLQFRRRRLH